jgi:transcriptional regulator with XRE-family HTH domain
MSTPGANLKYWMKKRGKTARDLLPIPRSRISETITDRRTPSRSLAFALAKALNTSPLRFLTPPGTDQAYWDTGADE